MPQNMEMHAASRRRAGKRARGVAAVRSRVVKKELRLFDKYC